MVFLVMRMLHCVRSCDSSTLSSTRSFHIQVILASPWTRHSIGHLSPNFELFCLLLHFVFIVLQVYAALMNTREDPGAGERLECLMIATRDAHRVASCTTTILTSFRKCGTFRLLIARHAKPLTGIVPWSKEVALGQAPVANHW